MGVPVLEHGSWLARGLVVHEAVEELHIFPTRSWTPTFFQRAPCVWQCVSLQLLLEELRTFPAVRSDNLDIFPRATCIRQLALFVVRCLTRSASAPGALDGLPIFLRGGEIGS